MAAVVVLALASGSALANGTIPDAPPPETEERSPVWLGMFLTSSVMIVGGISLYSFGAHRVDEEAELVRLEDAGGGLITQDDCGRQDLLAADGHFDSACTWSRRTRYAALTTLAAIPVAIVSGYFAFRAMPEKEKRTIALVPTVTTQSAGAMLDVRW